LNKERYMRAAVGSHMMHIDFERRFRLPPNAPARLIEDIETYSALVDLQNKMGSSAPWFQRLS
jgi:hypothetical protein